MDRHDNGDSLSWHYLDRVQKEFGPFAQATMREWFNQGFFPNGEELMIRLPQWKHHLALKMVWPDVSQAFMGIPQLAASSTLAQVSAARDGYEQYPAADIQTTFGGSRSAEEQPSYLGEALPMGGFWNGHADPSAAGLSNGLVGYPSHGIPSIPVTTESPALSACGLPMSRAVPNELLDRMPHMSAAIPAIPNIANPAIQSDLAGMGHLVMPGMGGSAMQGLMLAENQQAEVLAQSVDGSQFAGFAGIMMPMQQALNQMGNSNMQFMQMQMPGSRPAGRFRGRIKSFNAKQGFGFIENPEAYAMFGRDVFLHKAQIGNLKVGMEVTYGVEMNKFGMPQARDLATLDGKPPGPPPASVAKGGTKTKASGKRVTKGKEDGDAAAAPVGVRNAASLNLTKVPVVPQDAGVPLN